SEQSSEKPTEKPTEKPGKQPNQGNHTQGSVHMPLREKAPSKTPPRPDEFVGEGDTNRYPSQQHADEPRTHYGAEHRTQPGEQPNAQPDEYTCPQPFSEMRPSASPDPPAALVRLLCGTSCTQQPSNNSSKNDDQNAV